ncbi:MAG: amino acid permease [Oscillospiraceae bacterium]|jgi:amino acid transporter|nr:amino acid permease [Oscillospiraceae bacterium]
MRIKNLLIGRPLRSNELSSERLSRFWGVPIMASDAVSSVAYAIEEILMVLVPVLGFASVKYLGMVALPIIFLLLVLVVSYSQIISHYPQGGGAYNVSAENIGKKTALIAASALMVDYVMTVAVSLSSASAAIIAAFPALEDYPVFIALISLGIITLLNLRGINESSKIFGVPTYAFIVIMGILIVTGFIGLLNGSVKPIVYESAPPSAELKLDPFFVFVLLKAFSSGCSALTGIEAVSNAVPSFRDPSIRNAKHVLYILSGVIIFVFGGAALLAMELNVAPVHGKTVISQMGHAVFGNGTLFYVLQFATSFILILAANTAYSGLPNLLSILALDKYVPNQFAQRGARLGFSNGILFIFFAAGILIVLFQADTHHLIPLYSVGVFLSFTLSQLGMVVKWLKTKKPGWKHRMLINAVGAVLTAVGAIVVFSTKFADGAWMLAIVIPAISLLMFKIRKHYDFIGEQLKIKNFRENYHKSVSTDTNACVVLVSSLSRSTLKAMNYANGMSSNVTALHIAQSEEQAEVLRRQWQEHEIDIPLEVLESPFREIVPPIEEYISQKEAELKPGEDISVVLIKFVEEHWYDNILHNQTTYFIKRTLNKHRNVVLVTVPYLYNPNRRKH